MFIERKRERQRVFLESRRKSHEKTAALQNCGVQSLGFRAASGAWPQEIRDSYEKNAVFQAFQEVFFIKLHKAQYFRRNVIGSQENQGSLATFCEKRKKIRKPAGKKRMLEEKKLLKLTKTQLFVSFCAKTLENLRN